MYTHPDGPSSTPTTVVFLVRVYTRISIFRLEFNFFSLLHIIYAERVDRIFVGGE